MALVLMITMKFNFGNRVLNWFGANVFGIYILQRIPMLVLEHFGINKFNEYLFIVICLVVTVILTILFNKLLAVIDRACFTPKQKKL